MKVATLIASLAPFFATDAKPEDITAAVDAQMALDKSAKDKAAKDKAAKDKAAADKAAKDKAAKDGVLNLEGPETEIITNSTNDEEEVDGEDEDNEDPEEKGAAKDGNWGLGGKDKKAMDAAIDARVAKAVGARDALHAARRKVEPILGVVAYDSAAEVYKAALVKLGIAVDGVPPAAYGAMLDVATKASGSASPELATDGKVKSMSEAFPGFDRIRR